MDEQSRRNLILKLYAEIGGNPDNIEVFPDDHNQVMEFLIKRVDSDKQITLFKMDLEGGNFQDVKRKLQELL